MTKQYDQNDYEMLPAENSMRLSKEDPSIVFLECKEAGLSNEQAAKIVRDTVEGGKSWFEKNKAALGIGVVGGIGLAAILEWLFF